MYTFDLVVGDASGNGHRETDKYTVKSSLSKEDIVKALYESFEFFEIKHEKGYSYKQGGPELPFCQDYEDNMIPPELAKKFKEVGILRVVSAHAYVEYYEDKGYFIYPDSFTVLWINLVLFGAKRLWPDQEHKIYFIENDSTISIGGYGLF